MTIETAAALFVVTILGIIACLKYRSRSKGYLLLAAVLAVLGLLSGLYVILYLVSGK